MSKLTREREHELLCRLKQNDEQAFTQLFHHYKNKLYGFALGITASEEIAKDIVQDVFFKIWKNRQQESQIENFNALVYRIAKNAALDHLKKTTRETTAVSGLLILSDIDNTNDPFESLKAAEMKVKYEKALQTLPKQQRLVYQLRHIEGFDYAEIAKKLNLTVPTIRSHFRNALESLKAAIFLSILLLIYFVL